MRPSPRVWRIRRSLTSCRRPRPRLVDRYRDRQGITADRVRHAFATISYRFVGAPVRSFLPILIERAVQFELDH
ncbi:MAG: three-helix bundle dimerization domain-containing protein [Pseudonocardia sp.]